MAEDMTDLETKTELWDAVKENMLGYIEKNMPEAKIGAIWKARLIGAPGPEQYIALYEFFKFLKNNGELSEKDCDKMMSYDLLCDKGRPEIAQFFDTVSDDDARGQEINISMGTLWQDDYFIDGSREARRTDLARGLERMRDLGADVRLRATATDFPELAPAMAKKAELGLPEGSPIHFAKVSDRLLFIEFPHHSSTCFRISASYDLNDIEYAPGKSKKQLVRFFDKMFASRHDPEKFVKNFFARQRRAAR